MNKRARKIFLLTAFSLMIALSGYTQSLIHEAQVSGTFQADANYYTDDQALGINHSSLNGKRLGMNGYTLINYSLGDFTAGLRFESFMPPLLGFSPNAEGTGIANWFVAYKTGDFHFTAGSFYEQFGSGLVLRSYEEWSLGYDNAFTGFRAKYNPTNGIYLKGLIGYQRDYWSPYESGNRGIVRGLNAEINLNDLIASLAESPFRISLGSSFVSKYEKSATKTLIRPIDNHGSYERYEYNLPSNVGAWAASANLGYRNWNLMTEYARKSNNPSALNNFIYREGQAMLAILTYSQKGFGMELSAKRIDNMGFKSRMTEKEDVLDINFLPPITTQHHYNFANMYPYATQPNGEMALHGQLNYTLPKNTPLGGKYGTSLEVSYSLVNNIKKEQIQAGIPIDSTGTEGYHSPFFTLGDEKYFEDIKIQATKKVTNRFKFIAAYFKQVYDKDVIEGHTNEYGKIYTNIGVLDLTYRINDKNAIRAELQALFTKQDKGNWIGGTLEYTISPKWFFSVMDEYNYGNDDPDSQLHYYSFSVGYTQKSTRLALNFGRQREGLLCVGGICRYVPAFTGIGLTLTSNF
jgi:hypothetical protein